MLKLWVRKYLQFYAENFCLSKPVPTSVIRERFSSKIFSHVREVEIRGKTICLKQLSSY